MGNKQIKSELSKAQQLATAMDKSLDHLRNAAIATKDEQTILDGNTSAHSAIDLAYNKAQSIVTGIEEACANLQTVAQGFQAVDEASVARFRMMEDKGHG